MKLCFECGETATEEHHVIPRVMGGIKTVPLCTSCHMKVHGLDGTKRADNHKENIKRGIDKNRVWDLFAVYIIAFKDEITEPILIQDILKATYNHDITINRINTLYDRLLGSDGNYLHILFDQQIDSDLSHYWNEDDEFFKFELTIEEIFESLEETINLDKVELKKRVAKIGSKINSKFLEYKNCKGKIEK